MTDKPDYSPPAYLVLHWTNGVHIDEERATKFQALRTALCEKLGASHPICNPIFLWNLALDCLFGSGMIRTLDMPEYLDRVNEMAIDTRTRVEAYQQEQEDAHKKRLEMWERDELARLQAKYHPKEQTDDVHDPQDLSTDA